MTNAEAHDGFRVCLFLMMGGPFLRSSRRTRLRCREEPFFNRDHLGYQHAAALGGLDDRNSPAQTLMRGGGIVEDDIGAGVARRGGDSYPVKDVRQAGDRA